MAPVAGLDEVPEGRVKTVTAGVHTLALTNIDGEYTAMDNRCLRPLWQRESGRS